MPRLSVVVISRNEGRRLRETVENLDGTLPAGAEILVVDDGSTDGSTAFVRPSRRLRLRRAESLGVAAARNWGAAQTRGDTLIFADAHIGVAPGWWEPLCELLDRPGIAAASPAVRDSREPRRVGCGLTLPAPDLHATWLPPDGGEPRAVPVLPGCTLAIRRKVFESCGGFDARLRSRGGVDNEFCLRLWRLGRQLWVTPRVVVRHHFRRRAPFAVPQIDVLHNRLRLALVHFEVPRLARVLEALAGDRAFPAALALALGGELDARRALLARKKVASAESFFSRFAINW
jgi:glycosyltransferase involved in cell wall biosynthesis